MFKLQPFRLRNAGQHQAGGAAQCGLALLGLVQLQKIGLCRGKTLRRCAQACNVAARILAALARHQRALYQRLHVQRVQHALQHVGRRWLLRHSHGRKQAPARGRVDVAQNLVSKKVLQQHRVVTDVADGLGQQRLLRLVFAPGDDDARTAEKHQRMHQRIARARVGHAVEVVGGHSQNAAHQQHLGAQQVAVKTAQGVGHLGSNQGVFNAHRQVRMAQQHSELVHVRALLPAGAPVRKLGHDQCHALRAVLVRLQ